jgi:hypothetical protein
MSDLMEQRYQPVEGVPEPVTHALVWLKAGRKSGSQRLARLERGVWPE